MFNLNQMGFYFITAFQIFYNKKKQTLIHFLYQGFLSQTMTTHRTAGEGREPSFISLYHFHPLMNIQIFFFSTLLERWLSMIFNCTACIYQTATWWDLPPSPMTIWLIDDVRLIFVCLLDDLIPGVC